jgi:hypothetical protein
VYTIITRALNNLPSVHCSLRSSIVFGIDTNDSLTSSLQILSFAVLNASFVVCKIRLKLIFFTLIFAVIVGNYSAWQQTLAALMMTMKTRNFDGQQFDACLEIFFICFINGFVSVRACLMELKHFKLGRPTRRYRPIVLLLSEFATQFLMFSCNARPSKNLA